MTRVGLLLVAALALAACGSASGGQPRPDADGRVPATPRALAAVVVAHVDPGEPRRTSGGWSNWNDPLSLEAQVDYGVDPEGTEDGETRTVRVDVVELAAVTAADRRWARCRPAVEEGHCEEEVVGAGRLVYRWWPGSAEEEGGSYAWTVVRDGEVVRVAYERSDLFDEDPRTLGLAVEPGDLRAAALDPAMSLRTTVEAWEDGAALDHYEGEEEPPEAPTVVPTTPQQLADRVVEYVEREPRSVSRSRLTDFGPDAVGAHLEFPGTERVDPFTLDVLTTVGRVRQLDPLPCGVQRARTAARDRCFAWNDDSAATWTLADGDKPGVLWIVGAQDDDNTNRVESVGIRVVSTGITQHFVTDPSTRWRARFPVDLFGSLSALTADLSVGPEQHRTGG